MIIPTSIPWRLAGILALVAGVFVAGWTANGWRKDNQIAQLQSSHERDRAVQSAAHAAAEKAARAEEKRRTEAQVEIANDAKNQADTARADARAASAVADRLRQRVAALLRERDAAIGPAAASGSPPAENAAVVLADVLNRADARAGELAEFADTAHIAGRACERSYGALTVDHAAE